MIESLERLLLDKYDYKLEEHIVYDVVSGKSKLPLYTSIGFFVVLVFYILNISGALPSFIGLGVLIAALAVFVGAPVAFTKSKYEAIIVTPRFLIERIGRNEFTVIEYDLITDFATTNAGFIIKQNRKVVTLGTKLYREEIEPIIEILEAKGKTFDPQKEYMIRNVHIYIENNKIRLEDDETISSTEKLYAKYVDDFAVLTPGFLKEIMFRNTTVDDAVLEDDVLVMYLDGAGVKGGHPENTKFETIKVSDCVLIFEQPELKVLVLDEVSKDGTKTSEKLELDFNKAIHFCEKAVVSDWKATKNMMKFDMACGINQLHIHIKFKESMFGWNKSK